MGTFIEITKYAEYKSYAEEALCFTKNIFAKGAENVPYEMKREDTLLINNEKNLLKELYRVNSFTATNITINQLTYESEPSEQSYNLGGVCTQMSYCTFYYLIAMSELKGKGLDRLYFVSFPQNTHGSSYDDIRSHLVHDFLIFSDDLSKTKFNPCKINEGLVVDPWLNGGSIYYFSDIEKIMNATDSYKNAICNNATTWEYWYKKKDLIRKLNALKSSQDLKKNKDRPWTSGYLAHTKKDIKTTDVLLVELNKAIDAYRTTTGHLLKCTTEGKRGNERALRLKERLKNIDGRPSFKEIIGEIRLEFTTNSKWYWGGSISTAHTSLIAYLLNVLKRVSFKIDSINNLPSQFDYTVCNNFMKFKKEEFKREICNESKAEKYKQSKKKKMTKIQNNINLCRLWEKRKQD